MHYLKLFTVITAVLTAGAKASTAGILELVERRLPNHVDSFSFSLINSSTSTSLTNSSQPPNDVYTVANGANGTIHISGNSGIALASGLRWYLTTYAHVDIYWFIGSKLYEAPQVLPRVNSTYHGSSIVPWRYDFNTVTFSYTAAFWTWEDWELQLDWMALRGINLALAWVGFEKILADVLLEAGFDNSQLATFFSGPAFQAWNRFGNIQGSWGGDLPMSWINSQHELQKKIVARMVDLGITPALPCFAGFVPEQLKSVQPNASFVNGSQWNGFPPEYTNDTFLDPSDSLFASLQKSFIDKQIAAYGNVSHIYTLDQYNENDPASGDLDYLKDIASNTIARLKAADPAAVWMIQGWLFYSDEKFWTNERVEAFLGAVPNEDMLILDLFSESEPQWQRTDSYYGKPWIWCQLHGYGGNMGLYGQVENSTVNPIEALANKTSTMVGMGLTMEGQEGNEVIYDIFLDQAWSKTPLDTGVYFHDWVTSRYGSSAPVPAGVYTAWDTLRQTVYNNTNLTEATAVTKSIFVLKPNTTSLLDVEGHHSTVITYNPDTLVGVCRLFYEAAVQEPSLWDNAAYTFDLTDITRQVMANAFYPLYTEFVDAANRTLASHSTSRASAAGSQMVELLQDLDSVLIASGNSHFSLPDWIASARAWASPTSSVPVASTNTSSVSKIASFYEYNARNQVTLWGPTGQITDYASKQWGGLVASYYAPRWQLFVNYTLNSSTTASGENRALYAATLAFEEAWQLQTWGEAVGETYAPPAPGALQSTIASVVDKWPTVFA